MMDSLLEQRYEVCQEIGSGGFGRVCIGYDHKREKKVAIKLEKVDEFEGEVSSLKKEEEVYSKLKGKASIGIANIHLFGADSMDDYGRVLHYMVMDLLGPDLEELLTNCSEQFSLKTVLLLADQMIRIIQYVHSKDYIHGDIKPGNIVLGRGKTRNLIYMVDFGLAQRYRDSQTKEHIAYSDTASYRGTTRFTSLNCHQHIQQSRRDDLESLGYVLLYLLLGSLPWQAIEGWNDKSEKRLLVYEKKASISIEELCTGLPCEFVSYMEYCRSLQFDEEPDYDYLRKLFQDLYNQAGFTDVLEYDWTITKAPKYKSDKFVTGKIINASDILPWEMKYFFNIKYELYDHVETVDLKSTSVEIILEETFKLIFSNEIPPGCSEFTSKGRSCWKDIAHKMYADLLENDYIGLKWFKENCYIDYTCTNNKADDLHKQQIRLLKGLWTDSSTLAANLGLKLGTVFDELSRPSSNDHDTTARHDKVKGLITAVFGFLKIPYLTNGECRLEFDYKSMISSEDNCIKSQPDAVLYRHTGPHLVMYAAVEKSHKHKSDKFVTEKYITASDILPWEMKYFLNVEYESYEHVETKDLKSESVETQLEETLKFVFSNEIPDCSIFTSKKMSSWKDIAQQMYADLLEDDVIGLKWFKEACFLDYTCTNTAKDLDDQETLLLEGLWSTRTSQAANLGLKLGTVFDELSQSTSTDGRETTARHDKVKGLITSLFEFLRIPHLLNGECRLEFNYKNVLREKNNKDCQIKVRPDVALYRYSGRELITYAAVEVYGPYSPEVVQKIKNQYVFSSSEEKKGKLLELEKGVKCLSIEDNNSVVCEENEEISGEKTVNTWLEEHHSDTTDVYDQNKPFSSQVFRKKLNKEIRKHIPFIFLSDLAFEKAAGQLVAEIYAVSVQKERNKQIKPKNKCTTLGIFVVNEYVHLAKLVYESKIFSRIAKGGHVIDYSPRNTPYMIYASWTFNLLKPDDRMALFTFLYYYDKLVWNDLIYTETEKLRFQKFRASIFANRGTPP